MTAQIPETLRYKGEALSLCNEPLRRFLQVTGAKTQKLSSVPSDDDFLSTALWRGYEGSWKIEGNRLYLEAIEPGLCLEREGERIDLMKEHPNGIFAHWFWGELRCPRGEMLHYVHGGYGSVYQEDLILQIRAGKLIGERVINRREDC